MTEKLFYEDVHRTEFTATVTECSRDERTGGWLLVLDRTAFFPEQGGQSADTGTLDGQEVTDVRISADTIRHCVKEPVEAGRQVKGSVSWEHRFDFMQQHTGEHILSGLLHSHFGFDNVGFHLSSRETTLDLSGSVSWETLKEIEAEANRAVWKNLPVQISFPDAGTLAQTEYRSKLELTENVRLVEIPGIDVCACCAPHVDSTAQIGLIKITGMQSYKGGIRLNIACGNRALQDYSAKQDRVAEISVLLSARQAEITDAVAKMLEREKELLHRNGELQKEVLQLRAAALPAPSVSRNAVLFTGGQDQNAMRETVNLLKERYSGICAVFAGSEDTGYRFVLGTAGTTDRDLAAELRKHGMKCGGTSALIQGSTTGNEADIRKILNAF